MLQLAIMSRELSVKQHAHQDIIEILWQQNALFQQVAQLLLDLQIQQLETVLQTVLHHIMLKILLKYALLTVDLLISINMMAPLEVVKIFVQMDL